MKIIYNTKKSGVAIWLFDLW